MTELTCDIAIIGAGAGGLSLAAGAAQLGLEVILVEKGSMGGDCLNYGCVPSKSLLASAKRIWQAKHSEAMGLKLNDFEVDFKQVICHVRETIAKIAVHDSVERFEGLGVRVIRESGRFLDKSTLAAGSHFIKAKHFVIATGSSAAIPPIPGLEKVRFLTNETIFNLESLPKHLVVIGGGPIGCELSQAFAMLGSHVTILEGLNILNQDDADCVEIVRQSLIKSGVKLHEQVKVVEILAGDDEIIIVCEQNGEAFQVNGSHLLVAAGRKANIETLACEQAGINYTKRGIVVNARLRTSNKKIYALGDVIGQMQFTHVANAHAGIVLRNIAFKYPAKMRQDAVPWITFTAPELAHVGKTEVQCTNEGINPQIFRMNYQDNDRAQAEGETAGFIKIMTNHKGKLLGVSIVGHQAGELLMPWVMLCKGQSLRNFTDTIVAYPTLSELSKRVASQYYTPKLFSPMVKRIVRFLSHF